MPTLASSRRRSRPPRGGPPPIDTWRPDAWSPPPDESIDAWAERTIVLPRGASARPGPLDLSITPYLREILRACSDPDVEEITLMCSTQVGKTLCCMIVLLHCVDADPWPCMHVMPREQDAMAICIDRYQTVIRESPRLARHLTGTAHDLTRDTIRVNGAVLHFVGANSPAALAGHSICKLVLDETDKYPPFSGREADPIALARERTSTFVFRKILKVSTPTTQHGYIYREFLAGDQRRYYVPCPHCGCYQVLAETQIKWPREHTRSDQVSAAQSAWYECERCQGKMVDGYRPTMLRRGVWCPKGQTVLDDGIIEGPPQPRKRLSYHLPAWYSPWRTWSDMAAEFLRSLASTASHSAKMHFLNSWKAWIHEDVQLELTAPHLRCRAIDYSMGSVPHDTYVLTAGVDVQVDHLWYSIRGWGNYLTSWLIRCGQLQGWDELLTVLCQSRYYRIGGQDWLPVTLTFIDAGFRGDEVYNFCRSVPRCMPVRGDSSPRSMLRYIQPQRGDGSKYDLVLLDSGAYKAKQHRLIRTREGDPGAWHLPRDVPEIYFDHMTAEQQVIEFNRKTGLHSYRWKVLRPGAANHLFDCENYALAAADSLQLEHRCGAPPLPGTSPEDNGPEAAGGASTVVPAVDPRPPSMLTPPKRPQRPKIKRFRARFFGRGES